MLPGVEDRLGKDKFFPEFSSQFSKKSTQQKPLLLWPGTVIVSLQWLVIIGIPLFGLGMVTMVRTVGILLFVSGNIWLGNYIRKPE